MGSRYIEDIFNTVTEVFMPSQLSGFYLGPGQPVLNPTQIWMVRGLLLVYLVERRGLPRDTALMIVGLGLRSNLVVTQRRCVPGLPEDE